MGDFRCSAALRRGRGGIRQSQESIRHLNRFFLPDFAIQDTGDAAALQKVPSRLCAQVLCDGKPTEADMQTVLHTLKQVLESNDMPITYYDITLVPTGDYADHSAFMADVLESGLMSADTIA